MRSGGGKLVIEAAALLVLAAVVTGCTGAVQQVAGLAASAPAAPLATVRAATAGPTPTVPAPRGSPGTAAVTPPTRVVPHRPPAHLPTAAEPSNASAGPMVSAARTAAPPTVQAVLGRSVPVRLRVPAIGVDSSLMQLGLTTDGALQVPPGAFPAGWYAGSPSPGERGPAVIVGHIDWGGRLGVFARLAHLKPGDTATVVRADGRSATFAVTRVERFAKDAFPTQQVYGDIDHAGLRLITCGGRFDRSAHSYLEDVVVFADLVG